jgi:predicted dehydrogenase
MGDVRIALVGCGAMGEIVAGACYAQPNDNYQLVAVVDARPERAEPLARSLGVPGFAALADLFASEVAVEAVDLRLPHHLHAPVAVEAIEHGVHVLVEKPLATTLADGKRIVDAGRAAGVVVAVAENYPHLPSVRAVAEALARQEIGTVHALRTTRAYTLDGVWTRDGWRQDGGPSAGVLLDQGTHHTSLLRRLGGEIVSVSAQAHTAGEAETVLLTARFASGLLGQSLYSWGSLALDGEPEATVFGSTGRIDIRVSYHGDRGGAIRYDASEPVGAPISGPENYYDSHRLIIDDWAAAVAGHRAPRVPARDALADLAVVLAAARSVAEGGVPIPVPALD